MSGEELKEIVDGVNLDEVEEILEEVDEEEATARSKGWTGLEEFLESGKDKKDWVTAKHFNERGEWIAEKRKFNETKAEFEQRIKDNNTIWQKTLDKQISELESKRDDLIELADKEGVKALDKEIKDLDKQKSDISPEKEDRANNAIENEYLNSITSKKEKAYAMFIGAEIFATKGLKGAALIEAVSQEVDKEFPRTNPNRDKPSVTDKSKPTPTGSAKAFSSIAQLKGDNKAIAEDLINSGVSEKRVLQMLNDREKS